MKKAKTCCKPRKEYKGNNPFAGLAYGILPHVGCIAFVVASILGVTILMQFFRPFLMNRYIFHYLILISIGFATLSSFLYLRKNQCLCWAGIKGKKSYLSIMYGSTIGVNLVLFFLVFPFMANIGGASAAELESYDRFSISVNIPCPGHAPLISNELKTIHGVKGITYSFPNNFEVYYDPSIVSIEEIVSIEVFQQYPATIISTKTQTQASSVNSQSQLNSGSCSGGCGGSASCGGGCGSPSCSLAR